jgi:phosphoribosyl 1,2-cyclic phosphate phosphodiesterase
VRVEPGVPFQVGDASVLPLLVPHGRTNVIAYRIGPIGYVTDAKLLDAGVRAALDGIEILVLNALLRRSHPTHLSIDEAVSTARDIGAARTFFTHLTHDNFHADLASELPAGMSPAYDGLVVHAGPTRGAA